MNFAVYFTDPKHQGSLQRLIGALEKKGHIRTSQNPDVSIVCNAAEIKENRRPIVWIPHGISPSKWGFCNQRVDWTLLQNKQDNLADLMLLPGPWWRLFLNQYFPTSRQNIVTGWPKADALVDDRVKPAEISSELPVILFAPSWNRPDKSTVGTFYLADKVREAVDGIGTLVIAPHHPDRDKVEGVINAGDLTPWMKTASLLITDQSSTAIEFCVLDKPVIHITDLYADRGWVAGDGQQFCVGHMVKTGNELRDVVKEALMVPDLYKHLRDYWVQAMLREPGKATGRCVKAIECFVALKEIDY